MKLQVFPKIYKERKIFFFFEKFFCIPCISVETLFKMVKIEQNTEYTSRTRKVTLNLITKENLYVSNDGGKFKTKKHYKRNELTIL